MDNIFLSERVCTFVYQLMSDGSEILHEGTKDRLFLTLTLTWNQLTYEVDISAHAVGIASLGYDTHFRGVTEYHVGSSQFYVILNEKIGLEPKDTDGWMWCDIFSQISRYIFEILPIEACKEQKINDWQSMNITFRAIKIVGKPSNYDLLTTVDFCDQLGFGTLQNLPYLPLIINPRTSQHMISGTFDNIHCHILYPETFIPLQSGLQAWNKYVYSTLKRLAHGFVFSQHGLNGHPSNWVISVADYLPASEYPSPLEALICIKDMIRNLPKHRRTKNALIHCMSAYPGFQFVQWNQILIKGTKLS